MNLHDVINPTYTATGHITHMRDFLQKRANEPLTIKEDY